MNYPIKETERLLGEILKSVENQNRKKEKPGEDESEKIPELSCQELHNLLRAIAEGKGKAVYDAYMASVKGPIV